MVVVGKDLFGSGNIAGCPFQFDGVGSKVNVNVQPVFQHMQVFIPGTEQGFNVGSSLNALLHAVLAHPSVRRVFDCKTPVLRWHRRDPGTPVPV